MVAPLRAKPATPAVPAQGRLRSEDAEAVRELLARQPRSDSWVSDLESQFAQLSESKHVVAAAGSGAALSLILRSLDVRPDDEVIVPAYAPPSIAEVISSLKARPVAVDVQSDSLHIDPFLMGQAVTDRTKAVVAVAAGGIPVDAAPILNLVNARDITLIEDAGGVPVRPHAPLPGQVRCFATGAYGGNPLNAGALITVSDQQLADRLRARVNGIDQGTDTLRTLHMAEGMTEVTAAWQLALLPRLREDWMRRCELAMNYSAAFSSRRDLEQPTEPVDVRPGWHDYAVRLNLHHIAMSRDELAGRLQRRGIPAAVRWLPIVESPVLQDRLNLSPENFPVTRNEFLRELCLPIHASLTDAEVDYVVEAVFEELDASSQASQPLWRA